MIFLQPLLLAALPLIALPIVIHLINQRRYQTMPWAAIMFLLAANRMSRGYARIRQWLILLFRALAIAALIFAISRPLASGWIGGVVGGAAETTIVLVDRSPTMQQRSGAAAESKLESGTAQLMRTLETLGPSRYVLIESTSNAARELESIAALATLPEVGPTDATADLPAMLLTALDYVRTNKAGRTDIWICSDLRENDWQANDGRWPSLREAFLGLGPQVRFHLLAYPQPAEGNRRVRVTEVQREQIDDRAELRISLQLTRDAAESDEEKVPIAFEVDGARSVLNVDWQGPVLELKDHPIPLPRDQTRGWGRVSLPADTNPADNHFYFVFDVPPPHHTVVVTDDPATAGPLELAARIAPTAGLDSTAEQVAREHLDAVPWEQVALLLWQGPLPEGEQRHVVTSFVDRGGQVIFFPPRAAGPESIFGARWDQWHSLGEALPIRSWRGDADLLRNTLSGASLPVGQLRISQYSSLEGELTPLATLENGAPLVARVPTPRGAVYFCSTTPYAEHSTLAGNGIVLYVMVQRAIAAGAASQAHVRQRIAGASAPAGIAGEPANLEASVAGWSQLAGAEEGLSTEYPFRAGIYAEDDRLWAINRAASEDGAAVLADEKLANLFGGLSLQRVDDRAGSLGSLVQEVWRLFLIAMMAAMVVEAALCLPSQSREKRAVA